MKYLKLFENRHKYHKGDYVKVELNIPYTDLSELSDFLKNNIGQVHTLSFNNNFYFYYIKFFDVPESIESYIDDFYIARESNLRHATPKEIENFKIKQQLKKYNL